MAEGQVVDGGDQRPAARRGHGGAGRVDQVERVQQAGRAARGGAGSTQVRVTSRPGQARAGSRPAQPGRGQPFGRVAGDQELDRAPVDGRLHRQVAGQGPHVAADPAGDGPQQLLGHHPDPGAGQPRPPLARRRRRLPAGGVAVTGGTPGPGGRRQGRLGAALPGEAGRAGAAGGAARLAAGVVQGPGDGVGQGRRVAGGDQLGLVAEDLAEGRQVGGDHRGAAGQGLQRREAEALVPGGEHQRGRPGDHPDQVGLGQVAGGPDRVGREAGGSSAVPQPGGPTSTSGGTPVLSRRPPGPLSPSGHFHLRPGAGRWR